MSTIYLASASPRRQELLKQVGLLPVIVSSSFVEPTFLSGDAEKIAKEFALGKLLHAFPLPSPGICLSADTVVAVGNSVLAKPENPEHACEMLKQLSGREHRVITGVAIADSPQHYSVGCEITRVRFRRLSESEITAYVRTGEPMDKAGAYAIQGKAAVFIESISGCYYNVVGLPLTRVFTLLKEWGIDLTAAWR